jgi:alanyl-tRNA synthetase
MATSRKRSSGSTPISKSAIDQATSVLQGLPEKEKDTLSLRDAVELLQDSIVDSLSKGYSHEEVAAMLTERGVTINAPSLKYYLTALRRKNKTSGRAKTRRPRKSKNGDGGESEAGARKTAATGKSGVASVISYLMDDSQDSDEKPSRKRTSRKSTADESATSTEDAPTKRRSTASKARTSTKAPRSASNSPAPRGRRKSS